MGTLITELASKEILPGTVVRRLREYIKRKYQALSPVQRAGIFADAVNRIINNSLPELPADRINQFRSFLYGNTAGKGSFNINGSDVFKSSLRLKINDDPFIRGLKLWLERMLQAPVSEEKVLEYVYNVCSILDQFPEMDIEAVVESVEEKVGDIRPQKRIISVFHMNPSSIKAAQNDGGCSAEEIEALCGLKQDTQYYEQEALRPGQGAFCGEQEALRPGQEAFCGEKEALSHELENLCGEQNGCGNWIELKRKTPQDKVSEETLSRTGILFFAVIGKLKGVACSIKEALRSSAKLRTAAIAGLIAASVLCVYFSALYVNAVGKDGSAGGMAGSKAEIPAGIAVIWDDVLKPAGSLDRIISDVSSGMIIKMKATAYDLSFESCGKERNHPEYGITRSGTKAEAGRTVAVDPEVIPLGSSVRITFPEEYSHMDGIYVAEDTGRLIKGNSIDIFFGEDEAGSNDINKKALAFGVQYVDVKIIEEKTSDVDMKVIEER